MVAQVPPLAGGLAQTDRPRLLLSGAECRIERSLGWGGEGEVFSVEIAGGANPGRYALKWYHLERVTPERRAALENLLEIGSPHERFLWPIDFAELPGHRSFGYVMPLRPPEYRSILELVKGTPPWSARVLTRVGEVLADSFWQIHSQGLCYRDINFGNVFYQPDTGDVLICDNDNVGINGSEGQVWGTKAFMAPEVVRQEHQPDSLTDLHSLAVLLFYATIRHHPLIGARELAYADLDDGLDDLCGDRPVFIYDPDDDSNRPDPTEHAMPLATWPLYPQFVRDRFTESFTTGLHNRDSRVVESIWRKTMARLRDSTFACPSCGAELFAELPRKPGDPVPTVQCWREQIPVRPRFALFLGRDLFHKPRRMALSLGGGLFSYHLESSPTASMKAAARQLAAVEPHPANPTIWGLRNMTHEHWPATRKNGDTLVVDPGKAVRLEDGLRLQIATQEVIVAGTS